MTPLGWLEHDLAHTLKEILGLIVVFPYFFALVVMANELGTEVRCHGDNFIVYVHGDTATSGASIILDMEHLPEQHGASERLGNIFAVMDDQPVT